MTDQVEITAPDETTTDESTVEEQTTEQTQAEETQEVEPQEQQNEEPEWFKKRMDKMTYQRRQAERVAAAERQKADHLQMMLDKVLDGRKKGQDTPPAPNPKPGADDFDTDAEYIDALTDWKLDKAKSEWEQTQKKDNEDRAKQKAFDSFEQKRIAAIDAGVQEFDDWDNVVPLLPPNVLHEDLMADVFETDAPHKVTYYLGKNPQEAEKISRMSPRKRAVELGKIEAKLSQKPVKPTTKAPPPINPVGGKTPASDVPDPSKEPERWIRWRNEGKI